jgi:hypothetical protein
MHRMTRPLAGERAPDQFVGRASEEGGPTLVRPTELDAAGILRACLSPASFWSPEQVGPQKAWLEHAPFAFWLVDAARPRLLVELGTHGGYSYFAFCQAVQRLGLRTQCFAVDTWKGDEHSGFYSEEAYQEVRARHDRLYSAFSNLIRASFDEALHHFGDNTIDLLHIDGRHFYDDVKHDFESWRPKLSSRAVVVFHDTNARERNFGVFKLWEELCRIYPHFEFYHGYGLGVLGVGDRLPAAVEQLFAAAENETAAAAICDAYARLGSAISLQATGEQQAGRLAALQGRAADLEAMLQARSGELAYTQNELAAVSGRVAGLEMTLDVRSSQISHFAGELAGAQARLAQAQTETEARTTELRSIKGSASWRFTAPLRRVAWHAKLMLRKLRNPA